jgi:hypothetical protein
MPVIAAMRYMRRSTQVVVGYSAQQRLDLLGFEEADVRVGLRGARLLDERARARGDPALAGCARRSSAELTTMAIPARTTLSDSVVLLARHGPSYLVLGKVVVTNTVRSISTVRFTVRFS